MAVRDPLSINRLHVLSTNDFSLANRVSYEYDLRGPSITIKTGCSSSIIALHEACQSVASGECSSAIVAGANMILTPTMSTCMSDGAVLSPDGESKTFDADANGFARGEGVNAVCIKRLDDVLRYGDPIRAVIRSTASNSDGKRGLIGIPSQEAQEDLIRKAYQRAGGIDPVKPNVGHSEGASGLTSIVKAVLSLEHRAIAPNIRFKNPSPKIPFKQSKLHVPQSLTPWPEGRAERVSVNSFGIGGTNGHAILESAASRCPRLNGHKDSALDSFPKLLTLSSMSSKSTQKRIQQLQDLCKNREVNYSIWVTVSMSVRTESSRA
ncbi:thiolase-like protein [Aspergillus alliaceus]|uniref:Thiolase-like protein n=1 Tax=Petromyces alliaceus TaxID=209559 RepID=A0A5N7CB97_PETAA|nr:thiolase-like protein [Aspergillus alliaceus]